MCQGGKQRVAGLQFKACHEGGIEFAEHASMVWGESYARYSGASDPAAYCGDAVVLDVEFRVVCRKENVGELAVARNHQVGFHLGAG